MTVKLFAPDQKLIVEQEVVIRIGMGLYLDRFKLFHAEEDTLSNKVQHAFLLTMKSKLNPKLDLRWYQHECDSCRQELLSRKVDTLMPGAVRLHLMSVWFNNQGLPSAGNGLDIFKGQLAVRKNKMSGAFQMAPGGPHWQPKSASTGPIWVREKDGETSIYPALMQSKRGYFVIQARTRPLLNGKIIPLTESSLDQYKYFMAAYDNPESYYQVLACVFQPRTVLQIVRNETLKLIPAYGSAFKWTFEAAKAICLISKGKDEEAFFSLMKAGGMHILQEAVFSHFIPAKLRSQCEKMKVPANDEEIARTSKRLKIAYKLAKASYNVWAKSKKLPPKEVIPKLPKPKQTPKPKQPPKQNIDVQRPETKPPAEQDITSDLLKM